MISEYFKLGLRVTLDNGNGITMYNFFFIFVIFFFSLKELVTLQLQYNKVKHLGKTSNPVYHKQFILLVKIKNKF